MKLEELKCPKQKKNHRYYPQTKKETCKEYSDEHKNDTEILQYDSGEASFENEGSVNDKSLNLGRKFETSICF